MRQWLLIVLACLLLVAPSSAQETTPNPVAPPAPTLDLAALQAQISRAEAAAERAQFNADLAFNLLGLFEAIGFFVTVAALAGGVLGITQIRNARRDLKRTRRSINAELDKIRERTNADIATWKSEIENLRARINEEALSLRKDTANAVLANALLSLGERQYKSGDYIGAIDSYKTVVELDPQNPIGHQRLGYVYDQKGEVDLAERHYTLALKIRPELPNAMAGLGLVKRRQAGKAKDEMRGNALYTEAEALLVRALTLSPRLVDDDDESWWGALGGLYRRRGQLDQAIHAYERAVESVPDSSYGWCNLGMLYGKRGNRDKMRENYIRGEKVAAQEAITRKRNFYGYADLATARFALGKADEGEEALHMAVSFVPVEDVYMIGGLIDTLQELVQIVESSKQPSINKAIATLQAAAESIKRQPKRG